MRRQRGVTIIEVIIAMAIIIIASMGFLTWELNVFRNNSAIERNNTAYAMALDIADRLQRLPDGALITHNTNRKCVGYDGSANLRGCLTGGAMDCTAGSPTDILAIGSTGLTKYDNPWNGQIYMYDENNCEGKNWVDSTCGSNVLITPAANTNIDHPNAAGAAYNSIDPVRTYRNVTYYAVWSVAYLPCNAGTVTGRRKIFITVYWILPEPRDSTLVALLPKITDGTYSIKSVSLVVDKSVGLES